MKKLKWITLVLIFMFVFNSAFAASQDRVSEKIQIIKRDRVAPVPAIGSNVASMLDKITDWSITLERCLGRSIQYTKIRILFNRLVRDIRRSKRKQKRISKRIRILKRKKRLRKRQRARLRKLQRIYARIERKFIRANGKLLRFEKKLEDKRKKIKPIRYRQLKRRLRKIRKLLGK